MRQRGRAGAEIAPDSERGECACAKEDSNGALSSEGKRVRRRVEGEEKMEGGAVASGWLRWQRLWALFLPFSFFLWSSSVIGMETSASPSPAPVLSCNAFVKKTCEECVKNTKCLWCSENATCMDYPVSKLIPPSSLCELRKSYWGICLVNFEAIVITIGVVAGLLLIFMLCCCCYCCRRCCKCHPNREISEEEERFIRDREEKRMQSLQRKHERKVKHDEIRKKYGLLPDSDHPYSRYENE
nr:PTTG1IP family member 2 [Anolis sagrei ordinatus]